MKKFAKVSMITAGILFVTGAIILIICSFFAGSMRGALSDTVSNQLHNALNISIIPFWHKTTAHRFNNNYAIHSGHHTDDNAAGGVDITELYIDLNYTMFTLAPSQDDYFHISSEGSGQYQYYTEGSAFYIDGFYNRGANTSRLVLQIPDIDFSYVDINFGAGTATLSALKSDSLLLSIGAGELTIEDITCDYLSAEVGAGAAVIENGQTNDANFDIGMGNLTYKGRIEHDLNAEVGMGKITMQLFDSQDDHNYDLECSMGNITLGQNEYNGMAIEKEIDNNADSYYSLECDMGSINVTFENQDNNEKKGR